MPVFLDTTEPDFEIEFARLLSAKREDSPDVDDIVAGIIAEVRAGGDAALIELTAKFDRLELSPERLAFTREEIDAYCAQVPASERAALETAAERIRAYHVRQMPENALWTDPEFRGVLPKGTPVAQVIPVPRAQPGLTIEAMSEADIAESRAVQEALQAEPPAVFGGVDPIRCALGLEGADLLGDDDPATAAEDAHVPGTLLVEELPDVAEVLHVAALVGRQGDGLGVFLDGRGDHVSRGAVVPEVDDLGAGGLQDPPHDVDGGVVAIEERSGGDHADGVAETVAVVLGHGGAPPEDGRVSRRCYGALRASSPSCSPSWSIRHLVRSPSPSTEPSSTENNTKRDSGPSSSRKMDWFMEMLALSSAPSAQSPTTSPTGRPHSRLSSSPS